MANILHIAVDGDVFERLIKSADKVKIQVPEQLKALLPDGYQDGIGLPYDSDEGVFKMTLPIGGLKKFAVKAGLKQMHARKAVAKVPVSNGKSGWLHVSELDPKTADITFVLRSKNAQGCDTCAGKDGSS